MVVHQLAVDHTESQLLFRCIGSCIHLNRQYDAVEIFEFEGVCLYVTLWRDLCENEDLRVVNLGGGTVMLKDF